MADDASSEHGAPPATALPSSTHWTVVCKAGEGSSPDARAAFGEIYSAYLPALLSFLRYRGNAIERSMELLQGFFEHLLETNGLSHVRRTGRFRNWLLRALNNYTRDEWDRGQALKRGGGKTHIPVGADFDAGEVEPVDSRLTPEQAYDRKWAIALLKRVLSKLADEYTRANKQGQFGELKDFLPGGAAAATHAEVGARLGMEANTVAVYIKRLRDRYAELLWSEISDTVEPDQVEEEWRHLQAALAGHASTASGDTRE